MFIKRRLLVVGLVLMCVCGVAFCGGKNEGKDDPFKDTSVLVEAFVVRVSTEGLVKAGVNPISNAPGGISILNILWCLSEPGFAEVRSGVKAMACHHEESQTSNSGTEYLKYTSESKGMTNTTYKSYKMKNLIEVRPYVISMEDVKLYVSYANTDVVKNEEDSTVPATTNNFSWQGVITAKSGVPVIASAVQNDEKSITFMILTATIQDQQETKKK